MTKSNGYIIALLEIHCLPKPDVNEYLVKELAGDGMIQQRNGSKDEWFTTSKAHAYIDALQNVPLPTQVWVVSEKP